MKCAAGQLGLDARAHRLLQQQLAGTLREARMQYSDLPHQASPLHGALPRLVAIAVVLRSSLRVSAALGHAPRALPRCLRGSGRPPVLLQAPASPMFLTKTRPFYTIELCVLNGMLWLQLQQLLRAHAHWLESCWALSRAQGTG